VSRFTRRRTPLLERLFAGHHDLLAALRSLRRSPGFVAIAVLSLGLAIGLNTTMLAMMDAILHPYVPYAKPGQLFELIPYGMTRSHQWIQRPMYLGARERTDLYASIVPFTFSSGVAEANGHLVQTQAIIAGTRLFNVLGVKPIAGRTFNTTRDDPADADAVVVGYQLWQDDLGGTRDLATLHVTYDGRTYSVVGVMPPSMYRPVSADLWLPMPKVQEHSADGPALIHAVVRLKPGDTKARVKGQLDALAAQMASRYDGKRLDFDYRLESLMPGKGRPADGAVLAAIVTTLVLVVACLNLANLMLARGLARRRELAVRMALGANRGAIVRHVLVECALLAGLGGTWGVLLSVWGVQLAEGHVPTMIQELGFTTPHVSWRIVAIGILVTAATILVAGLAPALHAARANVNDAMKDGGSSSTGRKSRLYRLVVVGEIATALMVMIVAMFWLGILHKETSFQFSYDADHMLGGYVMPRQSCDSVAAHEQLWQDMTARITAIPGVRYAAASRTAYPTRNIVTSDEPGTPIELPLGRGTSIGYTLTTSQYFRVFEFPIVAGRDFEPGDVHGTGAAIVDRALAAKLWPLSSPVGRLIKLGPAASNAPWVRVVGVVAPRVSNADSTRDDTPLLTVARHFGCQAASLDVRTSGPPRQMAAAVYHVARAAVPAGGIVSEFRSPRAEYEEGLRIYRLTTLLFVALGAFALLLSAVGIYGVLNHAVGLRTREFAMRTALGAQTPDLLRIVVRDAMEMVLGGTAVGATASLVIGFGAFQAAGGLGALALAAAETVVIAASLAACIAPTRRATRADPVDLLRST